jgi:predicted exporter
LARASRTLAAVWLAGVAAILAGLAVRFADGVHLESSVLAMLPKDERDPTLQQLVSLLQGRGARSMLVLVGHADPDVAQAAAASVERELAASEHFESAGGAVNAERERAFRELYFPRRYEMLAPRVREALERGAGPKELVERSLDLLASPMSSAYSGLVPEDPLLFFPELVRSWSERGEGEVGTLGFPTVSDARATYALLTPLTAADPFDASGQRDALAVLEQLRERVAREFAGATLACTGVPRFAARARETMRTEMSWIGIGSTLGTLLCILLVLGSWRPLALSFLPILVAAASGTLACFLAFDDVHFLTLVFGTSLTGMGVDYALHYFCVHRRAGPEWDSQRGLRSILPGITLGMATSVLGFSGLCFTPFPVLRQFAVFSSVGLIAAWATVVCWFPLLSRGAYHGAHHSWFDGPNRALLALWTRWNARRGTTVVLVLATIACAALVARLQFTDDVRRFQQPPQDLLEEDRAVRELAGRVEDGRFVLVEGADERETLRRLEACCAKLDAEVERGHLAGTHSLAPFLPSAERRAADRELVRRALGERVDELETRLRDAGFEDEVIAKVRGDLATEPAPLDVATLLASSATQFLAPLWLGATERGVCATILLRDLHDPGAVEAALAGLDGVHFVDRVRDLSKLMERYRGEAARLVSLAYLAVLVALALRFGVARGLRVFLPAVLASTATLLLLRACGVELTLFHLLGLLLVLGLAVDYGTFLAESGAEGSTTMLALSLSAVTTVLAFGLMVFSSAPPLRALGASVALGITLSLILAPSAWRAERA